MGSFSVITRSGRETGRWGVKLARLLQGGEIIGLVGELGSGKTCFVRGMAEGLEVEKGAWIRSPTFTLINEYQGRLPIYHVDLYRVSSREQLEDLNLRDYLYSDGVSVVEWFEHLPADEVEEYFEVHFAYNDGNRRKLKFTSHGERYEAVLIELHGLKVKGFKGSRGKRFSD